MPLPTDLSPRGAQATRGLHYWRRNKSPPQPIKWVIRIPLNTPPRKHKKRRCLTSFDMTINGGGKMIPHSTPPEINFCRSGLVGKGSFAPSQYQEILRFAQDDTSCRFEGGLLTPSIQRWRFLTSFEMTRLVGFFVLFWG